ncbi:organic cation/carnitine transporter 2-like [Ciona intestinalis]
MLAKLAVTVTYSVLYVYTGELFPTNIRHGVFGISVAMARIGSILAPYVIYSDVHGNSIVTSLVMGALVFVSALLVFLLPKTKDIVLPGTVKEALKLNGRLCCIENKSQSSPLEISKEEIDIRAITLMKPCECINSQYA